MAINIKIEQKPSIKKKVMISRSLSGDYILREHPILDIIVMPEKNKVLVLPKEDQDQHVYNIQDKFFKHLTTKGVIALDSVKSGNIYGSLEGTFPKDPPGGENAVQVVVLTITDFIEAERPIVNQEKMFHDEMEKALLKPDVEDSTELGEISQDEFKGSIPKYGFPTRGIYRYNY